MIVQRKIMLDEGLIDFSAIEVWEDVEIPTPKPNCVVDWLATLPDDVGTEYRLIREMTSVVMKEQNELVKYIGWKSDSWGERSYDD